MPRTRLPTRGGINEISLSLAVPLVPGPRRCAFDFAESGGQRQRDSETARPTHRHRDRHRDQETDKTKTHRQTRTKKHKTQPQPQPQPQTQPQTNTRKQTHAIKHTRLERERARHLDDSFGGGGDDGGGGEGAEGKDGADHARADKEQRVQLTPGLGSTLRRM
eukprot:785125-Rhodomonas_salina.1